MYKAKLDRINDNRKNRDLGKYAAAGVAGVGVATVYSVSIAASAGAAAFPMITMGS